MRHRQARTALGLLSALGLALLGCRLSREESEAPVLALVRASRGHRWIEPRLSGSFEYSPCISEPRCAERPKPGTPSFLALDRAASQADRQVERHRSPQTLHAAGLANLLWPRFSYSLDTAVAELEEAAAKTPRDGSILSDLAAAYLVRGERQGDPYDLMRALAAAERARAVDRALPVARFNRALALQALFADTTARTAWLEYLEVDPRSAWSREAEDHLLALNVPSQMERWDEQRPALIVAAEQGDVGRVRAIVDRFRQPAREYAERELLGDWAAASAAGNAAAAARDLRIARVVGDALAPGNGDRMVEHAVAAIDDASRRGDPPALLALVEGHLAFRRGYALYDGLDTERALVSLAAAEAALARAHSPFAAEAAFFRACAEHNLDRYDEAARSLDRLWREVANRPYPSLQGHIEWMRGVTRFIRGDPMSSLASYEAALGLFERAGESEDEAVVHVLLAASLEDLGRYRDSWRHCFRALAVAHRFQSARHRFVASAQAADFTLRRGEPAVALAFQDDVVQHARRASPGLLADAHLWRGLMLDRTGERGKAMAELQKAERCLARNPDALGRGRSQADLSLVEGDLLAESDPRKAIPLLSSALDLYTEVHHHLYALLAYQARARAYRKLQDYDRAESDLRAALDAYQRLGEMVRHQETRLAYLAKSSELFDAMISFQANDRHRADRAFEYADRALTQMLPAYVSDLRLAPEERRRFLATEPPAVPLEEIRRRLPPATVLVQYSVQPDHLLVWVVRRAGAQAFRKEIAGRDLAGLVERFRRFGTRNPGGEWTQAARELSELLLAPWRRDLQRGEAVVFVPDKALLAVPFACLVDPGPGGYLIQTHRVAVAPSATLFVQALAREERAESRGAEAGLAVGNPAFASQRFPGLFPLPDAEKEAAEVAGLYPGSRLLVGKAATRREFVERVRRSPWVHYAGHAIVNDQNPLLSMLVLAPTPGSDDSGALYTWEIYGLDLAGTRLVVLSGCGTGDSSNRGSEGVASLARAFLAAGAPVVVASLWDVDDRITRKLFHSFYASLRAGSNPAEALRKAQLALLGSPESRESQPAAWGAFEVLGAGIQ